MVRRLAARYRRTPLGYDDALGAGSVASGEAARRFDPGLGVPFGGYAFLRVRGAMKDACRPGGRGARPDQEVLCEPRSCARSATGASCAPRRTSTCSPPSRGKLRHRLRTVLLRHACGVPSCEIAADLGVSESRVAQLLAMARAACTLGGGSALRLTCGRAVPPCPPGAPGPGARSSGHGGAGHCEVARRRESGGAPDRCSLVGSRGHRLEGLRLLQEILRADRCALTPREGRHPAPVAAVLARLVAGLEHRSALLARHLPDGARGAPPAPARGERGVHGAVLRGVVDREDRVALGRGRHVPGLVRADAVGL